MSQTKSILMDKNHKNLCEFLTYFDRHWIRLVYIKFEDTKYLWRHYMHYIRAHIIKWRTHTQTQGESHCDLYLRTPIAQTDFKSCINCQWHLILSCQRQIVLKLQYFNPNSCQTKVTTQRKALDEYICAITGDSSFS